jgi:hypothetical protein
MSIGQKLILQKLLEQILLGQNVLEQKLESPFLEGNCSDTESQ